LELQDDEIAFIIAHEISHILNDDIHKAYMKHYWIPASSIFATTWYLGHFSWYWSLSRCKKVGMTMANVVFGTAAFVTSSMSALETMRQSEFTADSFAMKTIIAAGFDPSVAILWLRDKAYQESLNFFSADQIALLESMSSHPTYAKRVANLE
jgi:Zn-dependent protease with chaperone function